MTPQSAFMILAAIDPAQEASLRQLLAGMNCEPGLLDPVQVVIPFREFKGLHYARFVILEDLSVNDITAYGLPRVDYPTYLAFLGDCDGAADQLLAEMVQKAGEGLRSVFKHCQEFRQETNLLTWMKSYSVDPAANYVNWIGRTVRQIGEEEALRKVLAKFLSENRTMLDGMRPGQQRELLKRYINGEKTSGRLNLTPPDPTPVGWWIGNILHLVSIPLLALILSPLVILVSPFFLIRLRMSERSDPEIAPRVDPQHARVLAQQEDRDVTNPFSAMGSLKPGLFRRLTMILVLTAINYSARHVFNRGRLARVISIQFARWVFLDQKRRVIFASNYDGSLESYMDDFINKVSFGLNLVFSNGIGYPRTRWLLIDGARDEQKFKDYLRRHQMPTQVWYNAHPGLTALDKWRNSLVRDGLEKRHMSDADARKWLQLL